MLRTRSLTLLSFALLSLAACKGDGKSKDQPAGAKPAPQAKAEPTPPPAPPPPPAPTYSAATAKQLVAQLGDCPLLDRCEAYKTLVGFGAQVGGDLLTAIDDASLAREVRSNAAEAVVAIKVADAGPRLVAAGMATDDSSLQSDLFKAAGACGGQATFDALIAAYATAEADTSDYREVPLRSGLRAFPAESLAWAKAQFAVKGKGKGTPNQTGFADLVTDSATAADLPVVVELLGKAKDLMARNRLASKAIELGDTTHFSVLIAGLKSSDQYDRSDAAGALAEVADKVPADLKPQLIELLEKGKAGDQGGLTARGYDDALAKLKK